MSRQRSHEVFQRLYEAGWRISTPLLRLSARLKDGFSARQTPHHFPAADIWIQAASAGEAYLACSLLENLKPARTLRVLVTSNTRQGLDIIERFINSEMKNATSIAAVSAFFPFDRPTVMATAVRKIDPDVMVLLETEIWPGLLSALKRRGARILILNGRLTEKSLRGYRILKNLWSGLSPDRILAVSVEDARRFQRIFPNADVGVMSNIKFDRLEIPTHGIDNPLENVLPETSPFLVLGSIRQEEEPLAEKIIREVRCLFPQTTIGLFPRHMHRTDHWIKTLGLMNIPWALRSDAKGCLLPAGGIVLWDRFGELNQAYERAQAVFVGGSLAPLGGQNFLEPLACGVRPVIGPHWDHFAWVGEDIIRQGLVIKADNWRTVSAELVARLRRPEPREPVQQAAMRYIQERRGGTRQACDAILAALAASISDDLG